MRITTCTSLVGQGVKGVWKNRMMSFASFCIMLVSLLLVGLTVLLAINLDKAIESMEQKNEIIVIIKDEVDDAAMQKLGDDIGKLSNVSSAVFFSRDEAWADMVEDMSEKEKELFHYADGKNPLPDTYRVQVKDIEIMTETTVQISAFEIVESVESPDEYADVLINIRNILTLVLVAIVLALTGVMLIIISNTTRASVFARRKEINIMRYVGATNTFIRIPFFVEGMLVGVLSGTAAFFLTKFVYEGLYNVLTEDVNVLAMLGINSLYEFSYISKIVLLSYIIAGAFIGAVGTTISTKKYCRV
ncbi:MAG: permease-like cell division protein FtsX [Oscillospiraceae bacterium]|nr:permease-like cell division protein FtsX [Oscillospiraceae bacterium]MBQ8378969.1 permease-like cell division protein FtsX [Oscillospiraceae bacterium]MBQ8884311.1 permease-like cell division protein FtsX [Oscillospiraceae bacterium]